MMLAIIDYGSGNLRSVAKAFEHVAGNVPVRVTSDAKDLANASHIVLPGVGAYGDCMRGLSSLPGMIDALNEKVRVKGAPFLGICVGMQMMFERGLEHGNYQGLGWLAGEVVKLEPSSRGGIADAAIQPGGKTGSPRHARDDEKLKIPHMGWNELKIHKPHPITQGIANEDHAYFVHSYHAKALPEDIIATVNYGGDVAAIVGREHMVGTQFHPEKSQKTGLAILQNFLSM
jgi:glutamine amidotransferase